jgi:hypothetical protein
MLERLVLMVPESAPKELQRIVQLRTILRTVHRELRDATERRREIVKPKRVGVADEAASTRRR